MWCLIYYNLNYAAFTRVRELHLRTFGLQIGKAIKKFFKGWRRRRELQDMRNTEFALHIRRRRFISKLICEGIVGGGCKGE